MTFHLAKLSKGEVCIDAGHSLLNGRPKFLPGRSRRVSFVANSILFNVNQPNTKHMTMPIYSLGKLLCIAYLCTSLLASCGPPQIIRSGSIGWWITPWWIAPWWISRVVYRGMWSTPIMYPHNYVFTQSSVTHLGWIMIHLSSL